MLSSDSFCLYGVEDPGSGSGGARAKVLASMAVFKGDSLCL